MKSITYALIAIAAIAVFALLQEHWSHLVGYQSHLLLLIRPFMHLSYGHGGYGQHQRYDGSDNKRN